MTNTKRILEIGSIEVRVKINGIIKRHILKVVKEKSAFGLIPYLVGDLFIPAQELIRLAEELQLPIKCHGMVVFPKGKSPADFAEGEPEKPKKLAHGRMMSSESSVSGSDAGEEESEDEESEEEVTEEENPDQEEESQDNVDEEENEIESDDKEKEETIDHDSESKENKANNKIEIEKNIEEQGENPEPEKQSEIEIEGSIDEKKSNEDKPDSSRKKFFSGVLSEGLLS